MDLSRITDPFFRETLKAGKIKKLRAFLSAHHQSDSDMDQALLASSLDGKEPVVRVLLETGARVDARDNSQWTPLIRAAALGKNLKAIKTLLKFGADINARNDYGRTALIEAASSGDNAILEELLKNGADPDIIPHKVGGPAIVEAGFNNRPECVILLARAGAKVDEKGKQVKNALHFMAGRGHAQAVAALIARGADVNSRSAHNTTPLIEVSGRGDLETVRILLDKGADPNKVDNSGMTALLSVAGNFRDKPEVLRLLISAGSRLDKKDKQGRSALDYAVMGRNTGVIDLLRGYDDKKMFSGEKLTQALLSAVISRDIQTVKKILTLSGADLDHQNEFTGMTPAMTAVANRQKDILEFLLEKKPDLGLLNKQGFNAFHLAAKNSDINLMKRLVEAGQSPMTLTRHGATALGLAAGESSPACDALEWLIKQGLDVNLADENKTTPLMAAVKAGKKEEALFLLDRGAAVNALDREGRTAIMIAAMHGFMNERYVQPKNPKEDSNYELIKLLLEKGADPNLGEPLSSTLLHAVSLRCFAAVKLLVDGGAGLGRPEIYSQALFALGRDEPRTLRLLISLGAEVNTLSTRAITPLMALAYRWRIMKRSLGVLIKAGADINATDDYGVTALMKAARTGVVENLELLLKKGARPELEDNQGNKALDHAKDGYGNSRVISLLQDVTPGVIEEN